MIILRAGNASPWTGPTGNNTYLIPGTVPTLIDAGVGNPAHLDALALALHAALLSLVLVTHSHADHASGVAPIRARWPLARIRNVEGSPVRDGEPIRAGDTALRAIHTPGHAPDHFCFFDETSGDLYCGDLVRANGTIVIPATRGGDLVQYLESLRRIRAIAPRRLLPGHGPVVEAPAQLIEEYLKHRGERDAQILEALRAGRATPVDIVTHVYGRLPAAIHAAAADTVLAHLHKLQRDGEVIEHRGQWKRRKSNDRYAG
jgi:glyoxylase-like metal-dependent hydrolase (beta-lactamase superfamily II)